MHPLVVTTADLDPGSLNVVGLKVVARDPTKAPNVLTGISGGDTSPVANGDTISTAISKLQAQIQAGAAGGDTSFTWQQSIAASTWNVVHPLAKFPSVTVIDSAGTEVEGDVHYVSNSQITLTFSAPFSGSAYLN